MLNERLGVIRGADNNRLALCLISSTSRELTPLSKAAKALITRHERYLVAKVCRAAKMYSDRMICGPALFGYVFDIAQRDGDFLKVVRYVERRGVDTDLF